ncbi:MAG: hypothetical protein PHP08_00970 [Candidatus Dojkabacteria bacterium]|nr:hypothetical protein [Candidatus Dojkabacteria bacterium]
MGTNNIPDSGVGGIGRVADYTNLGDEKTQQPNDINTKERMQQRYGLNEDVFIQYLEDIESSQQQWRKNEIEAKSEDRLKRAARTAAEIAIPIGVGVGADALMTASGIAGPLGSLATGAITGGIRATLEYKHIGENGENAAEFWQKNVGDRDKKAEQGGFFRKAWGRISRFLKGGSYLGAENFGFKVKERDSHIQTFLHENNINLDANSETLENPQMVFNHLAQINEQNPEQYKHFVKDLMKQSILSNFSEQKTAIEQKQMADLFCLANAVLYKEGNNSTPDNPTIIIDQLWSETKNDVKEIISKTKSAFIIGSATERAIKSVIGFYAVKWVMNGISKITELKNANITNTDNLKETNSLLDQTNTKIDDVQDNINSLQEQMNNLQLDQANLDQTATIDYKSILEPAAKAAGQDINTYLSVSERAGRVEYLQDIAKALTEDETRNAVEQLSQQLNVSPAEIVNAGILRWTYDSAKYGGDFGSMLEMAASDGGSAILSLQQAIGASENLHPAWENLAESLLEGTAGTTSTIGDIANTTSIMDKLLEQQQILQSLRQQKFYLQELQTLQQENVIKVAKEIFDSSVKGISSIGVSIADIFSSFSKTDYMYGVQSETINPTPTLNIPGLGDGLNHNGNDQNPTTPFFADPNPQPNADPNAQTNAQPNNQQSTTSTTSNTSNNANDRFYGLRPNSSNPTENETYQLLSDIYDLETENEDLFTKIHQGSNNLTPEELDTIRSKFLRFNGNWRTIYHSLATKIHPDTNSAINPNYMYFLNGLNRLQQSPNFRA